MTIEEPVYAWAWTPEKRKVTRKLILHHCGGSGADALAIHRMHRAKGWAGIGYHYYVRKDGSIFQGRPEERVGTHTAYHNADSIGVCFEGNFETEAMGQGQFDAGVALLSDIRERYPGLAVYGHRDLNATACPGRHFPMAELKEESEMAKLTQEEFNTMADIWLKSLGTLPEPEWSQKSGELQAAVSAGITDGTRPCAPATRVEVAAMILRAREE